MKKMNVNALLKMRNGNHLADCDGARNLFVRVFRVNMIVEKNAAQMVDFVLKDNRIVAFGFDQNVLADQSVVGFDLNSEITIDFSRVRLIDGKAAFPTDEIAFFDGRKNDFRIHKLIFGSIAFFVDRIRNDEHPLVQTDLRRGEADSFPDLRILFSECGILALFEISKHLVEQGFFLRGEGEIHLFRRRMDGFGIIFNDSKHNKRIVARFAKKP